MDVARVEAEFGRLKADFERGALTETEFKAKVKELMIEDEQGRWWTIGYETGLWYVNDGEKWVQQEPPRPATVPPPSQQQPQATAAPAVGVPAGPTAAVSPEPKMSNGVLVALASVGWLICLGFTGMLAISLAYNSSNDLLLLLLGPGAGIAGLITALALRLAGVHISWKQAAVIAVGCLLSLGLLGGLVTALALKWEQPFIQGKNVAIVTLGWAIGWGIGAVLFITLANNVLIYSSPDIINSIIPGAVFGAILGAVGTWVTLWQIDRAGAASPAGASTTNAH